MRVFFIQFNPYVKVHLKAHNFARDKHAYSEKVSVSTGSPQTLYRPGLRPWTPLEDFHPVLPGFCRTQSSAANEEYLPPPITE